MGFWGWWYKRNENNIDMIIIGVIICGILSSIVLLFVFVLIPFWSFLGDYFNSLGISPILSFILMCFINTLPIIIFISIRSYCKYKKITKEKK